MEKPLYPSKYMRITQGYNTGSHGDSYAIDEAGKDTDISTIYAPFTGIIKKIYPQDANEVWLESVDKVEYPDGTVDYMTVMFAHANDVNNLFVGQRINKGEAFYKEGTKGLATGNHCHIECGQGQFSGTGWYKNSIGNYSINNGKKPEECLWIDPTIQIIDNNGIQFKTIDPKPQLEPEESAPIEPLPNTPKPLPENSNDIEQIKLIYVCQKKDLYGIYLQENDELYLKRKS